MNIQRTSVLVMALLGLTMCGEQSSNNLEDIHNASYMGKGSVWQLDLQSDSSFQATQKDSYTDTDPKLTVNGSYEKLSSGYYKFTVSSADGVDAPEAGAQAYGFGVPGVMMVLKPIGGNSNEALVMPAVGDCLTEAAQYNWVQAKSGQYEGDLSERDLWGYANIDPNTAITGDSWKYDGTQVGTRQYAGIESCADGIYQFDDANGYMTMTQAGVGIVAPEDENGENDGAIITVPKAEVSAADVAGKTFNALLFVEGDETRPMQIEFDAEGNGTYRLLEDVENASLSSESGPVEVLEVGTGDKAGFLRLQATTPEGETPVMWAAVAPDLNNTGKAFFFASGYVQENSESSFSIIAIEQ